jgi:hypothetical protein
LDEIRPFCLRLVKMFIRQNMLARFDFLAKPNHQPTLTYYSDGIKAQMVLQTLKFSFPLSSSSDSECYTGRAAGSSDAGSLLHIQRQLTSPSIAHPRFVSLGQQQQGA